ncbi:hypothetical protein CDAR_76361 [Caerostris darwini]|uniref:Uncharacterized protein n=1 Tax=Caerostris darwini TaxID=1538125 RepID=A0AAV4P7J6_9ARAC|nr:hypothetical protein CDAR_76361 [Caerostris darwini]
MFFSLVALAKNYENQRERTNVFSRSIQLPFSSPLSSYLLLWFFCLESRQRDRLESRLNCEVPRTNLIPTGCPQWTENSQCSQEQKETTVDKWTDVSALFGGKLEKFGMVLFRPFGRTLIFKNRVRRCSATFKTT